MRCDKHKCEMCGLEFCVLLLWRTVVLLCLLKIAGVTGCHQPKSDPRIAEAHRHIARAWAFFDVPGSPDDVVVDFVDFSEHRTAWEHTAGLSWWPFHIAFDVDAPAPPWPLKWIEIAGHEVVHQRQGWDVGWGNIVWMYVRDPQRFEDEAWDAAEQVEMEWMSR